MLLTGTEAIHAAYGDHRAIPAFAVYNLEMVQAIVAAAEQSGRPVIMLAGSSHFKHAGRRALIEIALGAARASSADIGVHLDHCRDLDEIQICLDAGYTSVMVDGSHLPFEDNIALSRDAATRAHRSGAWIEAELGAIPGDEDVSTDSAPATAMTDPAQAADFVARTGVDALAVAIGNVHGLTSSPITLDLQRLADIRDACPIPLVLHGASGLPPQQLQAALHLGVAKVNINTELRRAYLEEMTQVLPQVLSAYDTVQLWSAGREAITVAALTMIDQLNTTPAAQLVTASVGEDPR
jgi:tagatose 1,6-diphosphate aldolase GatY/KbaY